MFKISLTMGIGYLQPTVNVYVVTRLVVKDPSFFLTIPNGLPILLDETLTMFACNISNFCGKKWEEFGKP